MFWHSLTVCMFDQGFNLIISHPYIVSCIQLFFVFNTIVLELYSVLADTQAQVSDQYQKGKMVSKYPHSNNQQAN